MNDWPGETVSMLVPSRSRTARSDARLLSEIARTATIAAMPMAMPTAVSEDRSLRDARPRPAIRAIPIGPGPRGSGMDPVRDRPAGPAAAVTRRPATAVTPTPRLCARRR